MKLSRVLAAPLAVGILAVSAPVAAAHDVVVGGEPADQAVLEEFPDEVSLEFSGYIQEDFNTFAVSDVATDEVLFSGEPAIDGRWASASRCPVRWTPVTVSTASVSRSPPPTATPPAG
ncbi:copper resistance protein CopC [Corynebacterium suedekumii]|nr:copper resistance protein CopC [Corynebacterium suedekumii]